MPPKKKLKTDTNQVKPLLIKALDMNRHGGIGDEDAYTIVYIKPEMVDKVYIHYHGDPEQESGCKDPVWGEVHLDVGKNKYLIKGFCLEELYIKFNDIYDSYTELVDYTEEVVEKTKKCRDRIIKLYFNSYNI